MKPPFRVDSVPRTGVVTTNGTFWVSGKKIHRVLNQNVRQTWNRVDVPSKEAYSTLSDYVYGSASLTRDSSLRKSIDTEKELTFTSSTSVYHVYYCLTPLSFKAFNYDCIARTSRRSRETSIRITSNAYRKQVPVLKSKTKVRKEKQRKNWKSLLVKTRWNLQ